MLYIHHSASISAQGAFLESIPDELRLSEQNKLSAKEPVYTGIPNNLLRRMGRSTRMSVACALSCMNKTHALQGIVFGTANGGMEDCIKFMEQIVKYQENDLTPGNFVQSTPNGIAAQIALMGQNHGYNITHAHRGLSFEMALLDALMLAAEHPERSYLVGGVDEISSYNFNVDFLDGWIKKENCSNLDLFASPGQGSIAGEGAATFVVSGEAPGALACVEAVDTLHTNDVRLVTQRLNAFLQKHASKQAIDLVLSGENGDARYLPFYQEVETLTQKPVARYKHLYGEFGTASAQALDLAIKLMQQGNVPAILMKSENKPTDLNRILIYNNYKATQHAFTLVSKPLP